jgi:hypothetical protein
MITHGDKKIEKQFTTLFHLHLHGATPLESVPAPDDKSEIVSPQLRVRIGCLSVSKASRGQDGADLDARLKALLAEGEATELGKIVSEGCTTA